MDQRESRDNVFNIIQNQDLIYLARKNQILNHHSQHEDGIFSKYVSSSCGQNKSLSYKNALTVLYYLLILYFQFNVYVILNFQLGSKFLKDFSITQKDFVLIS